MSLNEFLPPVLLAAAITFFLRALPFLIFHGEKRMPGWLERLGQALPSAIMAVLIVYCLKDAGTDLRGVALPQFLAVGSAQTLRQAEPIFTRPLVLRFRQGTVVELKFRG